MSRFGACILDPEGLRLSEAEKALFRQADPFGFILFERNIDSPEQVRALCEELRLAVGRDAPILIDQEGGRVQRLHGPGWHDWLPPLDHVAAAGAQADQAMYLRYRIIAHELHALGIDADCAPLADIAGPDTHEFLRNRCYGHEAANVARCARAVANGLLAGGVLPVLKHIPGHGRAVADSHLELPVVTADHALLSQSDFAAFRALNDLPMGMTAHLVYTAIDAQPATLSPTVMQLVRDEIGFDGLIMTDDIGMQALSGTPGALAHDARDAGCDVILFCNGSLAARAEVAEASGRLDAAGQARAERALAARRTPDVVDIPVLEAKLDALTDGRDHG